MARPRCVATAALLLGASIAAIAGRPDPAAVALPVFTVRIEFTTDPSGTVAEATLPSPASDAVTARVQQALLKKARQWRFAPYSWQGRPAATTFTRFIDIDTVPRNGGYALRVKGLNPHAYPGAEYAPRKERITHPAREGRYLMLYRVGFDARGQPTGVARASPYERFPPSVDALVAMREDTLEKWRVLPAIANGTPIACTRLYVMQVLPDARGERGARAEQGWYDEIDIAHLLTKEAEMARAGHQAIADACPPPRLQTMIAGMVL